MHECDFPFSIFVLPTVFFIGAVMEGSIVDNSCVNESTYISVNGIPSKIFDMKG